MRFSRYKSYRDSGVEWIGDLPTHWAVSPLGRVSVDKCDGPFGSGLKSEHYTDEGVRVIRLQNIRAGKFDSSDTAFIDETYYRESLGGHDVQPGDVLVAGLGDDRNTVGRACVAPSGIAPAMVKADCFRFRLIIERALAEFVASQLTAGSAYDAGILSSGSTRSRISLSKMATRNIALPPLAEQNTIIHFLNRESAKVDALVCEQERLIELLKEKRQAVISRAVTNGLDPNVRMKHSGVEWLGQVPAHWEIGALKRQCSLIKDGTHLPPARVDEGVPLLSVRNIEDGKFDFRDDDSLISEASYKELCKAFVPVASDVLLAIVGATLGKTAIVPVDFGKFHIQRSVALFRPSKGMEAKWLGFLFQSIGFQRLLWQHVGYSAQPGIYLGTLAEFRVPLPPLSEQINIVGFLDGEIAKLDALTAEASTGIALLNERRSALILAAVTGKIDVRGLVPTEAEAA